MKQKYDKYKIWYKLPYLIWNIKLKIVDFRLWHYTLVY